MDTPTVRKAIHVGRSHLRNFKNRQDACSLFQGEANDLPLTIGIICDGCSGGDNSEVGATLASAFLVRQALYLAQKGISASLIPDILYQELISFLKLQLMSHKFINEQDKVNFIENHLLFTVVGFILTPTDCVAFITGDGVVVINEEVIVKNAANMPSYPAYHLVDRSKLKANASELPTTFETLALEYSSLERIAIGSDAWADELDLIETGAIWGFKNAAGLQRQVNIWSQSKRFEDDVSIVTAEIHHHSKTTLTAMDFLKSVESSAPSNEETSEE